MTTDPSELYPVIAQITAAFAGFGSLASSLRPARAGDDAKLDAFRLFSMLQVSISGTLLGVFPATLASLGVGDRWALGAPAAAVTALIAYRTPISVRRASKLRRVPGYNVASAAMNNFCVLVSFAAFALCAAGFWKDRAAGLYLLGLVAVLALTVSMFSRVITSLLRRHHEL